jgi:hypothetical protein
MLVPE